MGREAGEQGGHEDAMDQFEREAWDVDLDDVVTASTAFLITQQPQPAMLPEGAARAEQQPDGAGRTAGEEGAGGEEVARSEPEGKAAAGPMPRLAKWLLRLAAGAAIVGVQLWARGR
jgi:hypothetical protein